MKKIIAIIILSLVAGTLLQNLKEDKEIIQQSPTEPRVAYSGLDKTQEYFNKYKVLNKTRSREEMLPEDLPMVEIDYDQLKQELKIEYQKYTDRFGNYATKNIAEGIYNGSAIYVPLFLQTDERWSDIRIGNTTLADGGCGVVSLCMVSSALGNVQIPSEEVAQQFNKYYVNGVGLSWDSMTKGARDVFGIEAKNIGVPTRQQLLEELQTSIAIVSFKPGTFTTSGHFSVISLDKDKETIQLLDPNDSKQKLFKFKEWEIDDILKEVKGVWVYSTLQSEIK